MKFVVFGSPYRRLGLLQDERILDLALAASGDDSGVFASLSSLIESGSRGLELAAALGEKFRSYDQPGLLTDVADAQLHAPFPGKRFAFAGGNNATHVANGFTNRGKPTTPDEVTAQVRSGRAGGFWVVSEPVGPGAEVPIPRAANGLFDYEGEVAVILGRTGKRLSAPEWEDRIWGAVLVIDWSIRDATSLGSRLPFYGHKIFDRSKSLGPWVSVGELDPSDCEVETRVNGEVRQRFSTKDMIHSFGELLAEMSEDLTLVAGDVLSGGTGPGTAVDATPLDPDGGSSPALYLKPGDYVEVSSPGLGSLQARVVADR